MVIKDYQNNHQKDFSLGSVEEALYNPQLSVLHSFFKNSNLQAPQILAGIQ